MHLPDALLARRSNVSQRDAAVVAQIGARMHYAVPDILAAEGRLERLYTDLAASRRLAACLAQIPSALAPCALRRLQGRAPATPDERITAFAAFGLAYAGGRALCRTHAQETALSLWAGRRFGRLVAAQGFGEAALVYAFNSAALEIAEAARPRGIRIVVEQTIAPRRLGAAILREEEDAHPDWTSLLAPASLETQFAEREEAEWECADLILCGSSYVRDGVIACGGPAERCKVVPYGVRLPIRSRRDETWAARRPLRVLTVGQVGLRKGSPYVVEAARLLGRDAEFRLVGPIAASPAKAAEIGATVQLVGAVPRSDMAAHYAWADVFLLPSLHEGSATATYEALSAGLPVVCTPNAGSIVVDGESGFIVPPRRAEAIAAALMRVQDSDLRARMSAQASQAALRGSLEAYRERLLQAIG